MEKSIQELIDKAHDQIELDVLISHGLDDADQAKYYKLLLKAFQSNKKGGDK